MKTIAFDKFKGIDDLRKSAQKGQLILIIGTGFTMGLADNRSTVPWDGLLRSLVENEEDVFTDQQKKDLQFLLKKDPGREIYTAQLLAAGYLIRDVLRRKERWKSAIQSTFKDMKVGKGADYVETLDVIRNGESPPLILTTNYDDLIATQLGWKVVFQNEKGKIRMGDPNETDSEKVEKRPPYLEGLAVAGQFLEAVERDWLQKEDRFVFHLHGWHRKEDSIVLDPADYERYSGASVDLVLKTYLLGRDQPVVFIGMGDGILDPHFSKFWTEKTGGRPFPENYWVLPPDEVNQKIKYCKESGLDFENKLTILECNPKRSDGTNEVKVFLHQIFS